MKKVYCSNELTHWGIKGQKWGIRRYQNEDGTLTEEGKRRYSKSNIGIYETDNSRVSGSISRQKTASRRISAAEKAVETYGGVNAAKVEVKNDYEETQLKNALKMLGTGSLSAATAAIGANYISNIAWRSLEYALGYTLVGGGLAGLAATTIGATVANHLLEKNKKTSISYINDVGVRKGISKNVVNSYNR